MVQVHLHDARAGHGQIHPSRGVAHEPVRAGLPVDYRLIWRGAQPPGADAAGEAPADLLMLGGVKSEKRQAAESATSPKAPNL